MVESASRGNDLGSVVGARNGVAVGGVGFAAAAQAPEEVRPEALALLASTRRLASRFPANSITFSRQPRDGRWKSKPMNRPRW